MLKRILLAALLVPSLAYGQQGVPTVAGTIYKGSSSGLITVQPQAAAGTWHWNWPITAGTSGFVATSGGGGASPMTWTSPSITINGTTCTLAGSCSPAGASGITSLTGDVTALGPGASAATLATVNSGPGSVGSSTAIPVLTTNGKGLVTAQTTAAVVAPAGTLTGATLASNVLASSLTSVGTLAGLTVTGSLTATGLITNADLVNAATTVNGQSCVLGAACTITASAGTVTVGTTAIASGTTTRVLYDNAGVLGEYVVSGSGNVAMTTSPTFVTPTIGAASATSIALTSGTVTGVPTPSATTDAANKAYVDNIAAGLNPAVAVAAGSAAVLPNSPTYNNGASGVGATLTAGSAAALVVDGYTASLNDRILVKNQAIAFQNGVYTLSTLGTGLIPWVLTRALDYNQPSDMNNTGSIPVVNGTANATTSWVLTSSVATVGTDALTFTQYTLNPTTIVTGPASATDGHFAIYSGSTGKLLKDTLAAPAASATTDTTVASNISSGTLPCGRMPALTGAVTSSAGSCATTAATITNEKCVTWDSTTAVTAQTIDVPVEWASYTLTSVKAKVAGGGSFTYAMQIGGTPVTGLNGITVNSASNVNTSSSGANTGSANDIVSMVIASPSGTVNQAYVCPVFTHTVN